MGEITVANIIPILLAQKPAGHDAVKGEATDGKRIYENQKELLEKIDLIGLGDWSQNIKKRHKNT